MKTQTRNAERGTRNLLVLVLALLTVLAAPARAATSGQAIHLWDYTDTIRRGIDKVNSNATAAAWLTFATNWIKTNAVADSDMIVIFPRPGSTNGIRLISATNFLSSLTNFPGWPLGGGSSTNALTNNYTALVEFRAGLTNHGAVGVSGAVRSWGGFSAFDSGLASYDGSDYVTLTAASAALDTSLATFNLSKSGVSYVQFGPTLTDYSSNLTVRGDLAIPLNGTNWIPYVADGGIIRRATLSGLTLSGGTLTAAGGSSGVPTFDSDITFSFDQQ